MPRMKENQFYFIVILLFLLIMALRMPLDTDMWWHLKAGQETWSNRQVYAMDTFSFTRQGTPWINHSWLTQVVMYLLFRTGGYAALSIWVAVCAVISMVLVYLQMEGHPLLRGAVLILGAAVAGVVWSPRPQIVSLVLFGLVSYLLYLYKWQKKNHLIWLVPIFLIWGNLHAGYVLGIILIGSVIGGELINKVIIGSSNYSLDWRGIVHLGLWAAGCMLVVLVNPFGIGMWKVPFNTVGVEALRELITEWASPDFHVLFQQPMLWMLFLVIAALGTSNRKIEGSDLLSLLVFSWLSFAARRNFGPFAMVAAPIITRHLNFKMVKWKNKLTSAEREIPPGVRTGINLILISLLLFSAGWKAFKVNQPDFVQQTERNIFPVGAVEFLKKSKLPGKIFNEYNWGGYLIWHLPEYQVFIDGRTDLFGDEILTDYIEIMAARQGWQEKINAYGINIMILKSDSRLIDSAINSGWIQDYTDDLVVVLVK